MPYEYNRDDALSNEALNPDRDFSDQPKENRRGTNKTTEESEKKKRSGGGGSSTTQTTTSSETVKQAPAKEQPSTMQAIKEKVRDIRNKGGETVVRTASVYHKLGTGESYISYDTGEIRRVNTNPYAELARQGGRVDFKRSSSGRPVIDKITPPKNATVVKDDEGNIVGYEVEAKSNIVRESDKVRELRQSTYTATDRGDNVVDRLIFDIRTKGKELSYNADKEYGSLFVKEGTFPEVGKTYFKKAAGESAIYFADTATGLKETVTDPKPYVIVGALTLVATKNPKIAATVSRAASTIAIPVYTAIKAKEIGEGKTTPGKVTGEALGYFIIGKTAQKAAREITKLPQLLKTSKTKVTLKLDQFKNSAELKAKGLTFEDFQRQQVDKALTKIYSKDPELLSSKGLKTEIIIGVSKTGKPEVTVQQIPDFTVYRSSGFSLGKKGSASLLPPAQEPKTVFKTLLKSRYKTSFNIGSERALSYVPAKVKKQINSQIADSIKKDFDIFPFFPSLTTEEPKSITEEPEKKSVFVQDPPQFKELSPTASKKKIVQASAPETGILFSSKPSSSSKSKTSSAQLPAQKQAQDQAQQPKLIQETIKTTVPAQPPNTIIETTKKKIPGDPIEEFKLKVPDPRFKLNKRSPRDFNFKAKIPKITQQTRYTPTTYSALNRIKAPRINKKIELGTISGLGVRPVIEPTKSSQSKKKKKKKGFFDF